MRAVCGHRARKEFAIVTPNPHRLSVEPRKTGYLGTAVALSYFKKTVLIKYSFDDLTHLKRNAPITRHDLEQRLVAAVNRVIAVKDGGELIDVVRHVREKTLYLLDAGTLVVRTVINGAVFGVHLPAAKLVFGLFLTHGALNHSGTCGNDLCGAFRHN